VLAAFHTCFNLANTGILIWFIPQIEKIVCRVIKSKKTSEESEKEPLRLQYIGGGLMQTPEIAVLQAQKEVAVYAERIHRMFGMVKSLLEETNDDNFVKTFSRIEKYESISDNMEIEIARYLERVGDEHISVETKSKIRSMMRQISEIESIGDACYNLSRTLNRRQQSNKSFNKELMDAIREMMALVEEALTLMTKVVSGPIEQQSINDSYRLENSINSLRDRLKTENISAINDQRYDYAIGTMFSDIIRECEKLGDYIVNVVQARFGK
jgi:phosphate:Na+ symporter